VKWKALLSYFGLGSDADFVKSHLDAIVREVKPVKVEDVSVVVQDVTDVS
jgi:hypothetical protein